jgi:hypothetical protein
MVDKFKINVVIGGRTYPLHVSSTLEEQGTRKAAEKINQLIVDFEKNYAVSDKQDVLAMSALQFATRLEIQKLLEKKNDDKASIKLQQMNDAIDVCLE